MKAFFPKIRLLISGLLLCSTIIVQSGILFLPRVALAYTDEYYMDPASGRWSQKTAGANSPGARISDTFVLLESMGSECGFVWDPKDPVNAVRFRDGTIVYFNNTRPGVALVLREAGDTRFNKIPVRLWDEDEIDLVTKKSWGDKVKHRMAGQDVDWQNTNFPGGKPAKGPGKRPLLYDLDYGPRADAGRPLDPKDFIEGERAKKLKRARTCLPPEPLLCPKKIDPKDPNSNALQISAEEALKKAQAEVADADSALKTLQSRITKYNESLMTGRASLTKQQYEKLTQAITDAELRWIEADEVLKKLNELRCPPPTTEIKLPLGGKTAKVVGPLIGFIIVLWSTDFNVSEAAGELIEPPGLGGGLAGAPLPPATAACEANPAFVTALRKAQRRGRDLSQNIVQRIGGNERPASDLPPPCTISDECIVEGYSNRSCVLQKAFTYSRVSGGDITEELHETGIGISQIIQVGSQTPAPDPSGTFMGNAGYNREVIFCACAAPKESAGARPLLPPPTPPTTCGSMDDPLEWWGNNRKILSDFQKAISDLAKGFNDFIGDYPPENTRQRIIWEGIRGNFGRAKQALDAALASSGQNDAGGERSALSILENEIAGITAIRSFPEGASRVKNRRIEELEILRQAILNFIEYKKGCLARPPRWGAPSVPTVPADSEPRMAGDGRGGNVPSSHDGRAPIAGDFWTRVLTTLVERFMPRIITPIQPTQPTPTTPTTPTTPPVTQPRMRSPAQLPAE